MDRHLRSVDRSQSAVRRKSPIECRSKSNRFRIVQVDCKLLHIANGADLRQHLETLKQHFRHFGSPVMMGGDADAASKCILGVKSDRQLLILVTKTFSSFLFERTNFLLLHEGSALLRSNVQLGRTTPSFRLFALVQRARRFRFQFVLQFVFTAVEVDLILFSHHNAIKTKRFHFVSSVYRKSKCAIAIVKDNNDRGWEKNEFSSKFSRSVGKEIISTVVSLLIESNINFSPLMKSLFIEFASFFHQTVEQWSIGKFARR